MKKKFTAGGSAVSTSHTGQKPCAAQMRSVLTEQPAASDTVKKFRNATSEGKKALLGFPVLPVKSLMWLSEDKTAEAYGQALNFRIREDVGKGDLHA